MENKKKIILTINTCDDLSTGDIAYNVNRFISEKFATDFAFFVKEKRTNKPNIIKLKDSFFGKLPGIINGSDGLSAEQKNTSKVCNFIANNKPLIVHLHNVHGRYINVINVLKTCKKYHIPVIWTIHDQWMLTNRCCYSLNCESFSNDCKKCITLKNYPKALFDNHGKNLLRKKRLVDEFPIKFISPSKDFEKQLKFKYPKIDIETINNGINTNDFYFKKELYLANKTDKSIILCVAAKWSKQKGYDKIIQLSEVLSDKYEIWIVGDTQTKVDDPKIKYIPSINKKELCDLYNKADIFFIPSIIDNYPTVIMEASCCGLPTIGFNVGGIPEIINEQYGSVIKLNTENLISAVVEAINKTKLSIKDKQNLADISKKKFNDNVMLDKYFNIYNSVVKKL